jgi:hypothetical protein
MKWTRFVILPLLLQGSIALADIALPKRPEKPAPEQPAPEKPEPPPKTSGCAGRGTGDVGPWILGATALAIGVWATRRTVRRVA